MRVRTVKCVKCDKVFAYWGEGSLYDLALTCPHCSFRDFAYAFSGSPTGKTGGSLDLDADFLAAIDDLCRNIERAELDVAVDNLSAKYHISKDSIIRILNLRLASQNTPKRVNPLRFRRLAPGNVSVDELMQKLEQGLRLLSGVEEKAPVSVAEQSPWRRQCEVLEVQKNKLEKQNAEMLDKIKILKEEIERLKLML